MLCLQFVNWFNSCCMKIRIHHWAIFICNWFFLRSFVTTPVHQHTYKRPSNMRQYDNSKLTLFSFLFPFFSFLFGFLHSMASYCPFDQNHQFNNSTTQIHMQIMFSRLVVSPFSVSPALSSSSANISKKIFVIYLFMTSVVQLIDAHCDGHHWWYLGKCVPCSVCDASQSIVLRPCQAHLDTVCGTLEDLEFELDWLKSAVAVQQNRVSYPKMFKVLRCWQKVPVR